MSGFLDSDQLKPINSKESVDNINTWTPKVCRTMAGPKPSKTASKAMVLHAFGVQVLLIKMMDVIENHVSYEEPSPRLKTSHRPLRACNRKAWDINARGGRIDQNSLYSKRNANNFNLPPNGGHKT